MADSKNITIIGGGIIGLACAHYLMNEGARVRIIEKNEVGSGASHGNCGLLYFTDIIPLCSPGAVSKETLRTLCGTSPLYIKPEMDFNRFFWLLKFASHCRYTHYRKASIEKYEILTYSLNLFDQIFAAGDIQCDFEKKGILSVFKNPKNLDGFQATNDFLSRFNLGYKRLDRDDTLDLEPALSADIAGSWYNEIDQHLKPDRLVKAWKDKLVAKGLVIVENCEVSGFHIHSRKVKTIRTSQGQFASDAFVLAAGAWSAPVAEHLNLLLPVQPGKGYSITMDRPDPCPEIPCMLYERNMVVTPWKSGYRLGGTMEFSGYGTGLNPRRLKKLLDGAGAYMKAPAGDLCLEEWASLRPMTYDDMPIIDRSPDHDNLVIATGHGMLGLTLATGTGKLVSDMLLEKKTEISATPYRITRFGT